MPEQPKKRRDRLRRTPKPIPWSTWLFNHSARVLDLIFPSSVRSFFWPALEPVGRFVFTEVIYWPSLLPLTRALLPLRCWIGCHVYGRKTWGNLQLDHWTWVKWSLAVSMQEAETMRFVAEHQHPDVPLPRLFDVTWRPLPDPAWNPAFLNLLDVKEPVPCIVMARARGVLIGDASWSSKACGDFEGSLIKAVRGLRQLIPAVPKIGSALGGPCPDYRICPGHRDVGKPRTHMESAGPFASVAEFHDYVCSRVPTHIKGYLAHSSEQVHALRDGFNDDQPIFFAHADLHWANIFVDPDTGHITDSKFYFHIQLHVCSGVLLMVQRSFGHRLGNGRMLWVATSKPLADYFLMWLCEDPAYFEYLRADDAKALSNDMEMLKQATGDYSRDEKAWTAVVNSMWSIWALR